jgi:hypothetical protein
MSDADDRDLLGLLARHGLVYRASDAPGIEGYKLTVVGEEPAILALVAVADEGEDALRALVAAAVPR